MSFETLHLCNASHIENINQYIQLIQDNDAVVFYQKSMTLTQYEKLKNITDNHRISFIIDNNTDNLPTITYDDWVDLVIKYKKTFTWK